MRQPQPSLESWYDYYRQINELYKICARCVSFNEQETVYCLKCGLPGYYKVSTVMSTPSEMLLEVTSQYTNKHWLNHKE